MRATLPQIVSDSGDAQGDQNRNNETTLDEKNGNGRSKAGDGQLKNANQTKKELAEQRDEDKLRIRYYSTYPLPHHSHGIFYKRNEAIIGSGSPVLPMQCYCATPDSNFNRKLPVIDKDKRKLSTIKEDESR